MNIRLIIACFWVLSLSFFGWSLTMPVLRLPAMGKVMLHQCHGFSNWVLYASLTAILLGGAVRLFFWGRQKLAFWGLILTGLGFAYFIVSLTRLISYLSNMMKQMGYTLAEALKFVESAGWGVLSLVAIGVAWATVEAWNSFKKVL